jgi:hypothetical protein
VLKDYYAKIIASVIMVSLCRVLVRLVNANPFATMNQKIQEETPLTKIEMIHNERTMNDEYGEVLFCELKVRLVIAN